jgi:hypothetical protein
MRLLVAPQLSYCLHARTRKRMNRYQRNVKLETIPNLVKIGQNDGRSCTKTYVYMSFYRVSYFRGEFTHTHTHFILRRRFLLSYGFRANERQSTADFRRLVAGLPPQKPGFDPGSVHVGLVVYKVALGQVFPQVLRFSPVNFIPPVLHDNEKRKK